MDLYSLIQSIPGLKVKKDELLSKHTTWKVGGPAGLFVEADNRNSLVQLLKLLQKYGSPYFLLGGGSDILVSDAGFEGVVIKLGAEFKNCTVSGEKMFAGCAVSLRQLSNGALANGLSGLEFAHNIPGTLGGAIKVNAGAFGEEISNIVQNADILDTGNFSITKTKPVFGYRTSTIGETEICLSAELLLKKGSLQQIKSKIEKLSGQRKALQPGGFSAGSVFKNPDNMFAGKLIEAAGCKGLSVGGAYISEKHANFIINKGNASARDILELIFLVRKKVYNATGIILEKEVILVGFNEDENSGFRE